MNHLISSFRKKTIYSRLQENPAKDAFSREFSEIFEKTQALVYLNIQEIGRKPPV